MESSIPALWMWMALCVGQAMNVSRVGHSADDSGDSDKMGKSDRKASGESFAQDHAEWGTEWASGMAGVGVQVARRRAERKLTLQRLADMVECAKSYLWQIENGRRGNPPSAELLERLERALVMPMGSLRRAAEWETTPLAVRARVERLELERRESAAMARELNTELARELKSVGLDEAFRSGRLRAMVERMTPGEAGASDVAVGRGVDRVLAREVPLINAVAAGYPREFTDLGYPARVAAEYVRTPDIDDADAFAARVVGASMQPDYREGDIVVFSPGRAVVSGMDCFVRLEPNSETTFKRVFFEPGEDGAEMIRLQPLNPAFAAKVVPREGVAGLYAAVSVTRRIG